MFFRELAFVLALKLSMVLRRLLRTVLFSSHLCCVDVVPIPKGTMSFLLSGFRPISITPVLSKVYERLISSRLCAVMQTEGVFPRNQYAYRKVLGTCDALLFIVCAGQAAFDRGRELAVVQIDFSAAIDRVSHYGLLYKLRDVSVGGAVFDIIAGFLSGIVQRAVVDSIHSENVRVVSAVPQDNVLGVFLFLKYASDLQTILENTRLRDAVESTL